MEILLGKNLAEIQAITRKLAMPDFTAKQIAQWIYAKRATDFEQMTNISVKNRELLAENYIIGRKNYDLVTTSADGTQKYLFNTKNGFVETVYLPETDRNTLCISCQAGCKMNCVFCMTGKMGFSGSLFSSEIINQILSVENSEKLTNFVFMGMGEPFDNTAQIIQAIDVITSPWGLALSPHRITVSSVGIMRGMKEFLEKTDCHLAISLHNPFHEERFAMMPIEKAYPIEKIVTELKKFDFSHQRRLSFEYIMFDGINDTQRHATGIVKLLRGFPCRVNLIRFHKAEGVDYQSPSQEKMEWFRDYISNNQLICTIRRSRGEDISAACGQLKTEQNQS
ncbi:MAG: 23S rRNA (adenine(2503)-C(2))-methyltransferase RlmN [Prevotellaceae bacterium]|jgi:23S rRNA (adenine2503-C2)-methyltransferase|nr:23S rRNA (adenine(2503)-C(2))-methyltransferase RlmN [Prevotellaceae bacterium]